MGYIIKKKDKENGMVLVAILMISIFLSVLAFALIDYSTVNLSRARTRVLTLQAQYASESGADATIAILNSGNTSYSGTGGDIQVLNNAPHYKAAYNVTVTPGASDKEKYIRSTGKVFAPANATTPKYTRTIEIFSQRSSNTTSASLVGRNIIWIESGVKSIKAKDLNVGGFIFLNRNTSTLIAENITITGQSTWIGMWCSLFGNGKLAKPTSFTDPGQTKTIIRVRANNCINPPGNSSNANFDVQANQSNLPAIQSTYIPWNIYMDSSYQNSFNGCSDWTTGSFPRTIPSSGNPKRTHYPNANAGVDTTGACASGGNLMLGNGQYNLTDNIHIRANLCGTTGCTPTFYNPDNGQGANPLKMKYVFVEGTINFNSLNTVANSGPIVFIAYGADPNGSSSSCPLGRSVFIGNTGTTNAPAAYLVALNGICLDKTRFGSAVALGGLSGKNIFINSNPGTPFDLALNDLFPVEEIPVDLSWKSTRYRRL